MSYINSLGGSLTKVCELLTYRIKVLKHGKEHAKVSGTYSQTTSLLNIFYSGELFCRYSGSHFSDGVEVWLTYFNEIGIKLTIVFYC